MIRQRPLLRLWLLCLMLSVGWSHLYGAWHGVAHAQESHAHERLIDPSHDPHPHQGDPEHSCLSLNALCGGASPISFNALSLPGVFHPPAVAVIRAWLFPYSPWLRPAARAPPSI